MLEEFGSSVATPIAGFAAPNVAGTSPPVDIASDAAGNIYVAYGSAVVQELSAAAPHTVRRTISGFTSPAAIALDANANLFVADEAAGTVSEFAPGSTVASRTIAVSNPESLAADKSGNVYVGTTGGFEVFAPGTTQPSSTTSTPSMNPGVTGGYNQAGVYALAIGPNGAVYVAQYYQVVGQCCGSLSYIYEYDGGASPGGPVFDGQAPTGPQSMTFDSKGDFIYAYINGGSPGDVAYFPAGTAIPVEGPGQNADRGTLVGPAGYFSSPYAVLADAADNVYVLDSGNVDEFALTGTSPIRILPIGQKAIFESSNP